jgi:SAM-dependent methyltransferase
MPLNTNTCPICMHNESRVTFTTKYLQKEVQVWRCKDCDFDFINTNLAPQQDSNDSSSETPEDIVKKYYLNFVIDREVASKSLDKRMPIFSRIRGSDIRDVLEIGCGPGTAYNWFRKNNINWMGLDVDENALDHA